MNLYARKGAINARLTPLVAFLAARRIQADALTLAAVPVGALAAACLLLSSQVPWLLVLVPFLATLRLILNLLDGQLARLTGRIHPRGELYNEVGDRLADLLFIAPVAFLPGAQAESTLLGLTVAVLASYVGITARAAGGERIYRGVLSKPGRMMLLSAFCLVVLLVGPGAWWAFGPLLLVGAGLTLAERLFVAVRRLP